MTGLLVFRTFGPGFQWIWTVWTLGLNWTWFFRDLDLLTVVSESKIYNQTREKNFIR